MTSTAAAPAQGFPAGWYGKIPVAGDFVVRRMPAAFSAAWDGWLQPALAGSRERLGGRWRDAFLSMPIWRFVFSPGMLTAQPWAGIMAPSVDAVGRYFPLVVAASLPSMSVDVVATLLAAEAWFDELESIALAAIGPKADAAAIEAAIAGWPFRSEWLRVPEEHDATVPIRSPRAQMLCVQLAPRDERPAPHELRALAERLAEPCAAWLAEESELFGRCLLLCETLPRAEQYCAMMDGRWVEHGWGRREWRAGAHTL